MNFLYCHLVNHSIGTWIINAAFTIFKKCLNGDLWFLVYYLWKADQVTENFLYHPVWLPISSIFLKFEVMQLVDRDAIALQSLSFSDPRVAQRVTKKHSPQVNRLCPRSICVKFGLIGMVEKGAIGFQRSWLSYPWVAERVTQKFLHTFVFQYLSSICVKF